MQEIAAKGHKVRKVRKKLFGFISMRVFLFVIVALWLIPPFGLLVSSFRSETAIALTGWWKAVVNPISQGDWTFTNYIRVLLADKMGSAFLNSLLVTIPATIIPITTAAFAAYAMAWMKFKGQRLFFAIVLVLLVVPLQMALIPVLRLYTRFQLNGTFIGIWIAHTGFGLPLAIYLVYNYMNTLPKSILESAFIDGATHFTIFTRLVLPLVLPVLASFAIFQFLWVWNDLLVALVFLGTGPNQSLLTTRLSELVGSRGQDWHVLTAGAFITMIMPLTIFFMLQRYFVHGLVAGSVKE